MISLLELFQALATTTHADTLSLSMLLRFIELASTLKPVILHRQKSKWNPAHTPAVLPANVYAFLSYHLCMLEEDVDELWQALGPYIWEHGEGLLKETGTAGGRALEIDEFDHECLLSDRILYPPTRVCTDAVCAGYGRLLRLWEAPKKVSMFSRDEGVYEGFAVHLTCKKCKAIYHPNYVARDRVREYYEGIPTFIQVSGHKYIETTLLEHFTTLSVLSWTSSTNAAHIYHKSLSKLPNGQKDHAYFRLRPEHTSDGSIILALLRDARDYGTVLNVPHDGEQKNRFTKAMEDRNDRIRRGGQPEYSHWCTRCVRRYDDPDGVVRYVDCVVTDGIEIGRPCCAVAHCREPLPTTQSHFCLGHTGEATFCVVEGCCYAHRDDSRTCALHAPIEDFHLESGKAMFTLRTRLQRAKVAQPTDAIQPGPPGDEDVEGDLDAGPCPEKTLDGNRSHVRARFGRRRTHNEQLIVRPCGIITCRETFYGSETVPQVVDMLRKKHLVSGSMPSYVHYNNNCTLYKHCAAKPGEDLHLKVGLPVDVFHWTCKHKKMDIECSLHCNPHMFPELLRDDKGGWFFNSSRAEQTNVWIGGYSSIVREMGAVRFTFFLDEMIRLKNELTRAKLEQDGCMPGYREDLRFPDIDVSE